MKKYLSASDSNALLNILQVRFERNKVRHPNLLWQDVQAKLMVQPEKLWSLNEMEQTGGEPDVVAYDKQTNDYFFYDCSAESPAGRRSVCYDDEALAARKENKPKHSAVGLAKTMGISILSEVQYRNLQLLGQFDQKTSSWVETPQTIRALGGAIFCDLRYASVFVYHNGAESYYAARGFRGALVV